MSSTRTAPTHRSRLARRLATETATGYQAALERVEQAATSGSLPPRLDAAGMDMALRILLTQDIEYWGPGVGAHPWPGVYHPLYNGLASPPSDQATAALMALSHAPTSNAVERGSFDPSYLAELGVEPLVDYAPDDAEDFDDEYDDATGGEDVEQRNWDEPERWRRFALTDGVRPAYAMPANQQPPADTLSLDQAALKRLLADQPGAVWAYGALASLTLGCSTDPDTVPAGAMAQALAWFECAVAVAETALPVVFSATLPWRYPENRPFLSALCGYADALRRVGRFNAAERVALTLLWLDPTDELNTSRLLAAIRGELGLRLEGAHA